MGKALFGIDRTGLFGIAACQCSVVKVYQGVIADKLKSDFQGLHPEAQARRRDREIVA